MRLSALALGMGALFACISAPASASAECQLRTLAEYPLTMKGNRALIDVTINGRPAQFLLDTGSYATLIRPSAAAAMGLTVRRIDGVESFNVGGPEETGKTNIRDFKLGGQTAHDIDLIVTGRYFKDADYAGLLGESILAQGDLELDFQNKTARLFRPQGCAGDQVVYWGKAYSVAPIAPSNDEDVLQAYVMLNGQRVLAEIDTGAYFSYITPGAAARAGATYVDATHDVAIVPSFAIGDEIIKNAKLKVFDIFARDVETPINSHVAAKIEGTPDMLLGADFVRAHHVYIARSQGKIYFSYIGGQIFDSDRPAPGAEPSPSGSKP